MKKLLDLFCGVGGAGEGYARAGFEVTGVDHIEQPNNPHVFIKGCALEYLKKYGHKYDVVHGSPPCQQYSVSTAQFRARGKKYLDHIEELREILIEMKIPYIIENVPGSPIRQDIKLKGYMFGLPLIRERHFELGNGLFMLQQVMPSTKKTVKGGDYVSVVGKGCLRNTGGEYFKECKGSILKNWRFAMNMPWAKTYKELSNAIPPAYTRYIGNHIIDQL